MFKSIYDVNSFEEYIEIRKANATFALICFIIAIIYIIIHSIIPAIIKLIINTIDKKFNKQIKHKITKKEELRKYYEYYLNQKDSKCKKNYY